MPRYYFNVYDDTEMLDKVGLDLLDSTSARREAMRYAGSLLSDGSLLKDRALDWRIDVTNEKGLILFRLDFLLTVSPAASDIRLELVNQAMT